MVIQVRDAGDGSVKARLEGHTGGEVTEVCFSPDGKLIASGGYDGKVRIWKAGDGELVHKIDIADDYVDVHSIAFSPNGKLLAVVGIQADGPGQLGRPLLGTWDVQTGKKVQTLTGLTGGIAVSVRFTKDGTTLMAGGGTGGIGLWKLQPAPEKK